MYRNYIFDLYGTLVDIHTNEGKASLWKQMAGIYACYGAVYPWRTLRDAYFEMIHQEEKKLREQTKVLYPEIDLCKVFYRLYKEAPNRKSPSKLKDKGTWTDVIANTFRVLSRDRLQVYPGTIPALHKLKEHGANLYLLSNAQSVFTRPEIEITGIASCFTDIFLSSDYGMKKPQPEFMHSLLQKHHMEPSETVMVGNDMTCDMGIADACGIAGIYLNTGHDTEEDLKFQLAQSCIGAPGQIQLITSGDILELIDSSLNLKR